MLFANKFKKTETNSQSSSAEDKGSQYNGSPFDYLRAYRLFRDENSFFKNIPAPQILQDKANQLEEALEYIDANLDDPSIPLDVKAKLLQKMGKELLDFYHLAYIHEVLNDDKKEKGLADMGLRILKDAYRVTTSYMKMSGIDIPLGYFNDHMYLLGISAMTYSSQVAYLSGVAIPRLIVKYIQAVEKLANLYISNIEKKNQQIQHENDNMSLTVKELSANKEYYKTVIMEKFHNIDDELEKNEKPNNIICGGEICPGK